MASGSYVLTTRVYVSRKANQYISLFSARTIKITGEFALDNVATGRGGYSLVIRFRRGSVCLSAPMRRPCRCAQVLPDFVLLPDSTLISSASVCRELPCFYAHLANARQCRL